MPVWITRLVRYRPGRRRVLPSGPVAVPPPTTIVPTMMHHGG